MWLPGASIWLASSEQRAQSGCGVIIDNVPYAEAKLWMRCRVWLLSRNA
jgi:hypothetical protein